MPEPTVCKFCGGLDKDGTNACGVCVGKYLKCNYCGHVNTELRGPALMTILDNTRWRGMPYDCVACGDRMVNKNVRAVGLPQVSFIKLIAEDGSIIRKRLWPKSPSST